MAKGGRLVAVFLDRDDDAETFLPLRDEFLDQFGRVLQIGDKADDRVAFRLEHGVIAGTDVAEITRIEDDLHVSILRRDLAQDFTRVVPGGVVDEDVLVPIAAQLGENFLHPLIAFADVGLLVVATADDANEFVVGRVGREKRHVCRRGGSQTGGVNFEHGSGG